MNKFSAFLLFSIFPFFAFPQKRINRYAHREKQGLWIIYHDSANTAIDNIGRYRKGIPKGTWRYYDPEKKLIKKEKHFFRKIRITKYYPNGKIYNKGKARVVTTDSMIHYFYYGNWYEYDTTGALTKKQFFREGNKISETGYKTAAEKSINDSLVQVVQQMDHRMAIYADSLTFAETKWGLQSAEYKRYVSLSNLNALKILDDIDRVIARFGYPGKTLVGDDYAIVFSIISSSTLKYKEKYYDAIITAADHKELDWSDVAYFVDKVKVAKKEQQVYGTQYWINEKEKRILYYPIGDKEHLDERRIKKGLPKMESLPDDSAPYQ
jgi:hypothetical protein